MERLFFSDMLRLIDSKGPCRITFVTCSHQRKTGGDIITITDAVQTGNTEGQKPKAQKHQSNEAAGKLKPTKNPHHFENGTRNFNTPNRPRPVKVYIWLITHINGKRVIV